MYIPLQSLAATCAGNASILLGHYSVPLPLHENFWSFFLTDFYLFRDIRRGERRWQSTENSDDITALQYDPSNHTRLLSGGDDGLVSIFDTSIQDENDSLLQAFDHGPIHKAGFLSDQDIYALSSDQRLTIYPVEDSELDGSVVIQPAVLGDLRSKAQCNYVIDVLSDIRQPYVITGSNLR